MQPKGDDMLMDVPVDLLVAHPDNCNRMNDSTTGKLHRHIRASGKYEPLTVRRHPSEHGKYQILNGHHRLKVLCMLGYTHANCVVWDVNDRQARIYLATLNRLRGRDVPERRALLLESLLEDFEANWLAESLQDYPACPRPGLAQLQRPRLQARSYQ